MKKIIFLIFIFSALLIVSFPREAMASIVYEVNVTINSIKIPERGVLFKDCPSVADCRNAEFKIIGVTPDITIVNPSGDKVNFVKRHRFYDGANLTADLFQGVTTKAFTFNKDTGTYSVYVHFYGTAIAASYYVPTADCISKGGTALDQRTGIVQYLKSGTWTNAVCMWPPLTTGDSYTYQENLYLGTSPELWLQVATIPAS